MVAGRRAAPKSEGSDVPFLRSVRLSPGRVCYISPFRYLVRSTLIGIKYTLASRFLIVLMAELAKARFQSRVGLKSEGNMILFVVSQ